MRIAMVGLGKMGLNMTRRLLRGGHEVGAADRSPDAVAEAAREGAVPAPAGAGAAGALFPPRVGGVRGRPPRPHLRIARRRPLRALRGAAGGSC